MAKRSNVVRVPRPSSESFNKNRLLSSNTLLESQFHHFRDVEKTLPLKHRTGMDASKIKTQAEAAEFIRKVTEHLHPAGIPKPKVRRAT